MSRKAGDSAKRCRINALAAHTQGRLAESIAADLLQNQGYKLLTRNFRCRQGEIDLICLDNNTLVFVEVRQRCTSSFMAAASIDARKMRRLVATARYYLYKKQITAPCRFDVVCIGPLTANGQATCQHIVDAFNLGDAAYR